MQDGRIARLQDTMDQSRWAHKMENLSLSDSQDDDDMFAISPEKSATSKPNNYQTPKTPATSSTSAGKQARTEADDAQSDSRDAALRAELESVRRINAVVEGVTASLEKARSNMEVCCLPMRPIASCRWS